jgi:hypothetical protein
MNRGSEWIACGEAIVSAERHWVPLQKCELRKRMFEPESKTDSIFFALHVYVFP